MKVVRKVVAGILVLAILFVAGVLGLGVLPNSSKNSNQTISQITATVSLDETTPLEIIGNTEIAPIIWQWLQDFNNTYPFIPTIYPTGFWGGPQRPFLVTNTIRIEPPVNPAVMQSYPGELRIPLFISATEFIYNIPGLPHTIHLNLTGSIIAQIYNGSISYWDDSQIMAINPNAISFLHHEQIIPFFRADGSGETFMVTKYLSSTSQWWNKSIGYGETVNWSSAVANRGIAGDKGMLSDIASNNYSIGYLGSSYLSDLIGSTNSGYAYLQNRQGDFVNITASTVASSVYPLVNYDYALVLSQQNSSTFDYNIRTFLGWALNTSQVGKCVDDFQLIWVRCASTKCISNKPANG
jgi:phosphate transport system substrate-binding protein